MKNTRRCKVCRARFLPMNPNQSVCVNSECITKFFQMNREKMLEKQHKSTIKEMKDRSLTVSDWRKSLQQVFNAYIRLRDKGKPCISCDRPLVGKYDAGHYYTVGSYPNLRYDERNCFGQCVHCNRDKHGNLIEYRIRLIDRIGIDNLNDLEAIKKEPLRLTIPEIQELIKYYKLAIKELQQADKQ